MHHLLREETKGRSALRLDLPAHLASGLLRAIFLGLLSDALIPRISTQRHPKTRSLLRDLLPFAFFDDLHLVRLGLGEDRLDLAVHRRDHLLDDDVRTDHDRPNRGVLQSSARSLRFDLVGEVSDDLFLRCLQADCLVPSTRTFSARLDRRD